ncbi:hypothetical protein B4U79_00769 [Dinothrombium tinctorium]|uniref:SRR1-like domain-containing protein n=1 Tax=Dinothrombium tinctorium TaxID=1965070 RepID=A0A3S3PJU3_9ACAR|nr:hypothetical protein B4U79_00769 [Dinothrombium tinctorium]
MNADGFQTVVNKRKKKFNFNEKKITSKCDLLDDCATVTESNESALVEAIDECVQKLKSSLYFESTLRLIIEFIKLTPAATTDLICYGLGSFRDSRCSRYQLAFFVLLKDAINYRNISIYDPIFTCYEKHILSSHYHIDVISENDRCKRCVQNGCSLFFMPHCDKILFNNLLWANWNSMCLNNIIIFGNSFQTMVNSMVSRATKNEYSYLVKAVDLNLVKEHEIINNFKFNDVFNDLNLHLFPVSEINESVLKSVYREQPPEYRSDDNDVL